jgi:hypothetical protein
MQKAHGMFQENLIWRSSQISTHELKKVVHKSRDGIKTKEKKKVRKSYDKKNDEYSSPSFYSIKYLGVTNDQIGILSKRTRIPKLSPMETCKDVPLAVINGAAGVLKKDSSYRHLNSQSRNSSPPRMQSSGKQDYVIHTYARPRGLSTSHKRIKKEKRNMCALINEKHSESRAVSGWKLTRPKNHSQLRSRAEPEGEVLRGYSKFKVDKSLDYAEPYLKYLMKSPKSGS